MKINIEKDEDKNIYVIDLYEYLETSYLEREKELHKLDCSKDDHIVRKFVIGHTVLGRYDKDGKCLDEDDEEMKSDELRMSASDGNFISFEIVDSKNGGKTTFIVDEFKLMSALTEVMRLKYTGYVKELNERI